MRINGWMGVVMAGMTTITAGTASAQDAPVVVEEAPPANAPAQSTTVVTPPATPVVVVPPARERVVEGRSVSGPALLWSGVSMFAISYGAAALTAAVTSDACKADNSEFCIRGGSVLYAPIAGPFIAISRIDSSVPGSSTAKVLLALDGAFQIGGVAMSIAGAVLSARAVTDGHREPVARRLILSPYASATGLGLSAAGHF